MNRQARRKMERETRKGGVSSKDGWSPLVEADRGEVQISGDLSKIAAAIGVDEAEALRLAQAHYGGSKLYTNDLYEVVLRPADQPGWTHLAIRRHDGGVVGSWLHKQQIKNQLLGPECEALELYPAQSRLVDAGPVYHLWGRVDPDQSIEVGFEVGFVPSELERAA